MALPSRKSESPGNWTNTIRILRMVALLVVIGVIVYQRYQTSQQAERDPAPAGGDEVLLGNGEHQVAVNVVDDEPAATEESEESEKAAPEKSPEEKPPAKPSNTKQSNSKQPAAEANPKSNAPQTPSKDAPSKNSPQKNTTPGTKPVPGKTPPANKSGNAKTGDTKSAETETGPITVIKNVQIRNLDGKVVYQGNIDVAKTLARIEAKEHLRFPNDGVVFQNRERRLPSKPAGYYHEWVHPTPNLSGPGPQRIVTGDDGEIYYTHDHYRTFKPLHRP